MLGHGSNGTRRRRKTDGRVCGCFKEDWLIVESADSGFPVYKALANAPNVTKASQDGFELSLRGTRVQSIGNSLVTDGEPNESERPW